MPKNKIKLITRDLLAIQYNQSNRNAAKGLFKSIISGKALPSMLNLSRLLNSVYKGWINPKKENPYLNTGAPEILPGFLLKGLMRGSQLESQLSKAGTVSTNSIKALANKSDEMQGRILNKVLDNLFPALRVVDYNKFRKAVLSELIPYNTAPATKYADYGLDRIGYSARLSPENVVFNPLTGLYESKAVKLGTFTFLSPRIPVGSAKHYNSNTLGHTRTFTNPEEPDVLNVLETLSDWALNAWSKLSYDKMSKAAPHRLEQLRKIIALLKERGIPSESTEARIPLLTLFKDIPSWHIHHLLLNYLPRQLQENMLYASENGYSRMRYPTRDTAIKVEGYEPTLLFGNLLMELYAVQLQDKIGLLEYLLAQGTNPSTYMKLNRELNRVRLEYETLKSLSTGQQFTPQEETILKKYDLFPKMFGKLFKDLLILIVTDNKGNNWFLFDVPSNMRQMELRYYNGGVL